MPGTSGGGHKRPQPARVSSTKAADELIRVMKQDSASSINYRQRSLKIYGLICAKCGREFNERNQQLLTVHHKDGNHNNNPSDGSNWENLCVFCHDDEHSRGILADYLRDDP